MFKVGDRVRRTAVGVTATSIQEGLLGHVSAIVDGKSVQVVYDAYSSLKYLYRPGEQDRIEPAPTPQPEQPGACSACLGTLNSVCPHRQQQMAQGSYRNGEQQMAQQPPACAVRVCSSECDAAKDQLGDVRQLLDNTRLTLREVELDRDWYRRELRRVAPKLVEAHERPEKEWKR